MALLYSRIHGIAEWLEIGTLEKQDLRLHQPATFKRDPPERHYEGIVRLRLDGKRGCRPDRRMDRMPSAAMSIAALRVLSGTPATSCGSHAISHVEARYGSARSGAQEVARSNRETISASR